MVLDCHGRIICVVLVSWLSFHRAVLDVLAYLDLARECHCQSVVWRTDRLWVIPNNSCEYFTIPGLDRFYVLTLLRIGPSSLGISCHPSRRHFMPSPTLSAVSHFSSLLSPSESNIRMYGTRLTCQSKSRTRTTTPGTSTTFTAFLMTTCISTKRNTTVTRRFTSPPSSPLHMGYHSQLSRPSSSTLASTTAGISGTSGSWPGIKKTTSTCDS